MWKRSSRTVIPRSSAIRRHGATLAWWSSRVTTTSSPAPHPAPSARARWNVSVVMLAPKTISSGWPFSSAASRWRAPVITSSVSRLVRKHPCVFAFW